PAIKSGYDLFQIATDDIPSKIVFAGYRFLFAGGLLLLFALLQHEAVFVVMQRLELRSRNAILLLFLTGQLSTQLCPFLLYLPLS
ncbi:EamA/RhaT family transporter, partial [Salmonella enterica subsp. enterica serovar Anatum]|nr:EamA/RhaT family transporter [Salmonella enterica subsp. enterica serovar Anatum]